MRLPKESLAGGIGLAGAALALALLLPPSAARGYTPDSPEVQAMVKKGLDYLTSHLNTQFGDTRLGAKCLKALCFIKYYKHLKQDEEAKKHPAVLEAVEACKAANMAWSPTDNASGTSNYGLGIALMMLCEVDPVAHRQLIETYVATLVKRQKPVGAWTYDDHVVGDTSQTQYAVLGMWMAQKVAKIDVPLETQEACAAWLMRTQSRNGGYGYHPKDPGSMQNIDQEGITLSLSAAGTGSLYIMADLLQVTESADSQKERPGPFKYLEGPDDPAKRKKGPLTKTLKPADIRRLLASGDGWFRGNYNIQATAWQHYYMYALERYEAFKDLANGKWTEEPQWYNDGVKLLQETQQNDGGWAGQDVPTSATCFSILFLLRSTQVVIQERVELGDGIALGGLGLPADVSNLREDGKGKLVTTDITGEMTQVLAMLEKGNDPNLLRMIEDSQRVELDGDVTKRQSQIESLRKFVRSGEPRARQKAIQILGRLRGLDNVPQLLFALTDPDMAVVIEADKALCFVSRQTGGVGLPHDPEKITKERLQAAQDAWKAWYLSVKPDAELLD